MTELPRVSLAIVTALALLPVTALLFILSALLERSGPIRLRHWVENAGGRLRRLYENRPRFEAFRYLLNLAAKLAPIGLFLALLSALLILEGRLAAALAFAVTALTLAGTELASRSLLLRGPEVALRRLTPIYRPLELLLTPLSVPFAALLRRHLESELEEESDEGAASQEEIEAFIEVGAREGILDAEERELVRGVVDFGETQVRSVMTPRIDMVCAPASESLEALAEHFVSSSHSRIPIYRESIDQIAGVLHIRDVLAGLRAAERPSASAIAQPPLFVPETKLIAELLRDLQAKRQQMAIVLDEYGGTAGLVTVEDLLEEIVGEIRDEHDTHETDAQPLPDGSLRLDGRAHIELLAERFGAEFEDAEFETVGGLVSSVLGYVPRAGETVETRGLWLTVEEADERRVLAVRVRRAPLAGGSGDA